MLKNGLTMIPRVFGTLLGNTAHQTLFSKLYFIILQQDMMNNILPVYFLPISTLYIHPSVATVNFPTSIFLSMTCPITVFSQLMMLLTVLLLCVILGLLDLMDCLDYFYLMLGILSFFHYGFYLDATWMKVLSLIYGNSVLLLRHWNQGMHLRSPTTGQSLLFPTLPNYSNL